MSQLDKKYHVYNGSVSIIQIAEDQLRDDLPAAIYGVSFNPFTGFSLSKRSDKFDLPEHIFGDVHRKVDRLMKRYDINGEISALLSGAKGSGKTLLAHAFCNKALEKGKAVIVIDNDFENPAGLKEFLNTIGDAVFIFDEFAKVFEEESQQAMLDFFSGSSYQKRATFVIENRASDINEFMLDRPGRMRFHFKYGKLPMAVVKEVCDHFELATDLTRLILNYAARSITIGMDTLNRLIEECIMDDVQTKEEFTALVEDMNIPTNRDVEFKLIDVKFKGKHFSPLGLNNIDIRGTRICGNLYNSENHPLTKAIIESAETDEDMKVYLDSISYEKTDDDDKVIGTGYHWYDFELQCSRPTFSVNGELIFIHKQTGIQFTVAEDDDGELGDVESLLV